MKYSIVIPAYNETSTISPLVSKLASLYSFPIIIIDDGSHVPIQIEDQHSNVHVIRNISNKGKGYSILKGLRYSSELKCTHTITLDGDNQHNPANVKRFINLDNDYDLVLGARKLKSSMPLHRILSNKITSFIISKFSKIKVVDSQCGFRMYRNSIINSISFRETGFQFESEVFFKIDKQSIIKHVDIDVIYNDKKSHINNVADTLRFVRLIIREIIYGK